MSKISELSDGGALQSTDYLIAVRSGGNVKVQPAGMTFSSATFTTVDINGGTIDGVTIGGSSAGAGSFTTLTASGDVNFDSGTLFVDASTNEVGIGTSSPQQKLHVNGGDVLISITNSVGASLIFDNSAADQFSADKNYHEIDFITSTTSSETTGGFARIRAGQEVSGGNNKSFLGFWTAPDDGTATEKARIASAEFVVNEGSEDYDFRVESDTDTHAIFLDAGNNALSLLGGSAPVSNSVCIEKDLIVGRTSNTPNFRHDFAGGGYKLSRSGVGPQFFARSGGATGAADVTKLYINDEAGWATVDITGNVDISGALSKGSGSFKIDHPVKPETHHLVHSFVEAPQADNIYRGRVELVNGTATVNIDTVAGMTEGTFALLNREVQCFTSNESGWAAVRGKVDGNILTIEAQDPACTDTISWMVVGERQDQHMYDTDWTDENGKVIVEPLKETEGA